MSALSRLYYERKPSQEEAHFSLHTHDVNELQADTILSVEPFPLLEEIVDDPEGEAWSITKEEFEAMWSQAVYA